jgi:hypothetical protein
MSQQVPSARVERGLVAPKAGRSHQLRLERVIVVLIGEETPIRHPKEQCPRCLEHCGTLTLFTSMVRYYRCARCGRYWEILRDRNRLARSSVTVAAADGEAAAAVR